MAPQSCFGPGASIKGGGETATIATLKVGRTVRLSAVVVDTSHARVGSMQLFVAKPGSSGGVGGGDAGMSMIRQTFASGGTMLRSFVPRQQHLRVTFTPKSAGVYPVRVVDHGVRCGSDDEPDFVSMMDLGRIRVLS